MQVGDYEGHVVATYIHAGKVDCRVGQAKDVGTPASGSLNLTQVVHDLLLDKLLYELGDRGHTDVQLLGQLREGALAIESHVGNDVTLDNIVLVRNSLNILVGLNIEKFGKRRHIFNV